MREIAHGPTGIKWGGGHCDYCSPGGGSAVIPPLILLHGADFAPSLLITLLYVSASAAILLLILLYDADSASLLLLTLLYEGDSAALCIAV